MPIERSYRDEIGREREYEMIIILTPDVPANRLKEIINRIIETVEKKNDGRVLLLETWGKRKLAYPIKKRREGIYYYWRLLGHGSMISDVEKYLRMSEFVLRFFALKLEDNVDPAARPSDITPEVLKRVADLEYVSSRSSQPEETPAEESQEGEGSGETAEQPEASEDKSAEETAEASSEGSDEKEE